MGDLIVNNISFDQDYTVLCAATNRGYRLYELNNFSIINEVNDYQDLIGNIKLAVPLHKSRLVLFVGHKNNLSFPNNQLIIWDDFKNTKIGIVILKENIIDFKTSRNALFIMIPNKIMMFELLTLNYVCSFEDVDMSIKKCSYSLLTNPLVLAYSSESNKSIIKISKILIGENKKLESKFQMMVITTFSEIQFLQISQKSDLLMAFSKFGNKIHIYSLEDFQLKFCLFLTANELIILNSCFNNKSRFFSILSYNGSELNLNIIDLKKSASEDHLCHCDDNDDDEVNQISSNYETKKKESFLGNFFDKISNTIFAEDIISNAKLRIKLPKKFYVDQGYLLSPFLMTFHNIYKDSIV